jgi:hypothetical protein
MSYADFKVSLRLGEAATTLLSSHFSDCTVTIGQMDPAGARGNLACTGVASVSQGIELDFVVSRRRAGLALGDRLLREYPTPP